MAKNPLILEADRREEFSPVKNKTGVDSLESSMEDQIKKAHRWLSQHNLSIPENTTIEICPRSYPSLVDTEKIDLQEEDLTEDKIYLTKFSV